MFAILSVYNIMQQQKNNMHTFFVFQSYMKTFMKLNLKKEKISDVQKVLRSGSNKLEFKDFRETLKE